MKALYGFVWEMADNLPITPANDELMQVKQILDARRALPTRVLDAIDAVESAKESQLFLHVVRSLESGQRLIELARGVAEERMAGMKHMAQLADVRENLEKLISAQHDVGLVDWYTVANVSKVKDCVQKAINSSSEMQPVALICKALS